MTFPRLACCPYLEQALSVVNNREICLNLSVDESILNSILVYNSNKMHKTQSLFNVITALHVSGVTITHLQEHKTTASTASGNHYTVLLSAAIVEEL